MKRRGYRGLNFSVLKSESIFGYPFWRCKRGPACTKWQIDFGTHFGWFVKKEQTWKMGLNFSVLISESIFGYPFWRCKCGPRCTKWRIEFGPHFGWSVKNKRTRISRSKLFGFKIREHIWIPILEMQVWPRMHKVTNWFRDSFQTICEKWMNTDIGGWTFRFWNLRAYLDTLLKRFKMLYKFLKRI